MRALLMPVRIFLDVSNKVTNSVTAVGFKQMPTYAPIRYCGNLHLKKAASLVLPCGLFSFRDLVFSLPFTDRLNTLSHFWV
jgi:hypothetical protein